jgi:aromatic-amino-acid transaminase
MNSPSTMQRPSALIDQVTNRPGDDPIFSLNTEAKRRAATGESILNATLGALMDDEGKLAVLPSVAKAIAAIPTGVASAYAPIAGPAAYLDAVVRDTFGDGPLREIATAVATPGGTGAILHTMVSFLEEGQSLLTSSYYWSPYQIIATHTGRRVETFEMFDGDGRFNLPAFEAGLEKQFESQGRALVILNFPCHNPTGYSLDEEEWRGLAEVVERMGGKAPLAILFDIAYAKFGAPGSERWVDHLEQLSSSAQVLIAWSASKAFAQYGSRIGALIALESDEEERGRIFNALSYACRGTWSNCNHLGMLAITELLTHPESKAASEAERRQLVGLLGERVEAFNAAAAEAGLGYPRYEGGFFVTVFTPDAAKTAEVMRDDGVFVVPIAGSVRLALCSVPVPQIPRLVESVARGIEAARKG